MELRKLLSSTFDLTAATLVSSASGLVFWWVASKFYPPQEIGVASAILSVLNLIFALSTLGLNIGAVRFYGKFGKNALWTMTVTMVLTSILMTAAYIILDPSGINPSLQVSALLLMISGLGALYNALGYASIPLRKTRTYLNQSILYSTRMLPLPFLQAHGWIGSVISFGTGLAVGTLYGLRRLGGSIKGKFNKEFFGRAIKLSFANYLGSITGLLPVYLMPSIVLETLGREATAHYYIGFMILNLTVMPLSYLAVLLLREGSEESSIDRKNLQRIFSLLLVYWAIAGAVLGLLGEPILRLFGESYVSATEMLKIGAFGIGISGVLYLFTTLRNLQEDTRRVGASNVINGLSFLLFGTVLVGRVGIAGPVIGWIIGNTLGTLVLIVKIPKTF